MYELGREWLLEDFHRGVHLTPIRGLVSVSASLLLAVPFRSVFRKFEIQHRFEVRTTTTKNREDLEPNIPSTSQNYSSLSISNVVNESLGF